MKQLQSLITIQKLAEKLRNFEIGPSDDLVCHYIRRVNGLYFDTDSISTRCRNRVHVEIESIGGPYFDNI